MKSGELNKVMIPLAGRPMIAYALDLLKKIDIQKILIVVGFAKESVKKFLGPQFLYIEQRKRLGTAHAVKCALAKIPALFKETLVLNGDDSAFYRSETLENLIDKHREKGAAMTLLTIETKNPQGLGRILRNAKGEIAGIVEEKDASQNQQKIKEVNPACYVFQRSFLKAYLSKVRKSPFSGEYYLTELVRLGVENGEKVESLKIKDIAWRGINNWEELRQAEKMMRRLQHGN